MVTGKLILRFSGHPKEIGTSIAALTVVFQSFTLDWMAMFPEYLTSTETEKVTLPFTAPASRYWQILNSSNGSYSTFQFGGPNENPFVTDFDGDGRGDVASFNSLTGMWTWTRSSDNNVVTLRFGTSGDLYIAADFDGDSKSDPTVYRPSTGEWWSLRSSDSQVEVVKFGIPEDLPVAADYDGDGKADRAVYRPSSMIWYLLQSNSGFSAVRFGLSTDIPLANRF